MAPATTFTLLAGDLDRPLPGADPVLARILRRYAATLPQPQPTSWHSHFRQVLAEAIGDGEPSLAAVARRLAVSVRTLQRRLTEHGTTWRAELETARHDRARQALQASSPGMTRLARQLGYADPARSAAPCGAGTSLMTPAGIRHRDGIRPRAAQPLTSRRRTPDAPRADVGAPGPQIGASCPPGSGRP